MRLFIGLGENETALATDIWLKALALDLIRITNSSDNNNNNSLQMVRQFLTEADALPEDTCKLPPFSKTLVFQLPSLIDAKPEVLSRLLLSLFVNPTFKIEEKLPRPSQSTMFCQAIIEEPLSDSDTVLKFTGGLILGK